MPQRIDIEQLTKTFPAHGGGTTHAVDHVDLAIEPGELFFLLGPSGCGKTTLLRMIAGFIEPTSGLVRFDGRDITPTPANKRNTGMVFQSYALWPHMTVHENVAFGLKVRKIERPDRDKRIGEALEAVQMDGYADRKPTQLSGGQQQRVALARALVIEPDVLLLDEPLSNLDAKLRNELRSEIRRICKQAGITSIYVTHDQKEALSMADRIAIMRSGKVEQVGTPGELYQKPNTQFVAEFLGETNILRGEVVQDGGAPRLKTASGEIEIKPGEISAGRAVCSIRPESWSIVGTDTPTALAGEIEHTLYLGEVIQHSVRLTDTTVRVLELGAATPRRVGDRVGLRVDPGAVALIPAT
ncbi:MAG: ABC transporter ATP-binding protein [Phycisphaeraceae bacterium]|nr:MAG: ABC transporter ATP-binding protein [Phycisphaeraceae bacterium]